MGQLKEQQLKQLNEHRYSCTSTSLMDPMMQRWWVWLVSKCPMWLAPNLITITGLLINIVTSLILIYYSPDAKEEVPWWTCFLCALGLFTYQSLDAIDGKQARRTGNSSPLGELFDHGCDSLSTVFVSLSVCCAVQLGTHANWMFFQCMMAVTLFYCAHWQTYVSGTLRFGFIDVTEAQFGVMAILMVSSVFGSSFWSSKVPGTDVMIHDLYIAFGVLQLIIQMKTYIPIILWGGAGKHGSTIAGTSVLSPIVPLFSILAPSLIIAWRSPDGIYQHNPTLYLLTFGMVAARVTNRLVVAHMTKSEMEYIDSSLMGPVILFLNQCLNCPISEHVLLWIVCAYVVYDLIKYCYEVCQEICVHLRIHLFTIVPKPQPSETTEKNGSSAKYNTRSTTIGKVN
ncbi:choline/ethanolaminephosphotransferase 1 bbc isoform X2 [Oratosquilla oratoria]|uniref:choline/ethanolaminephosphotransferase 1 bbc isoform X2 n=1 Tax=Oratosquilla oratoria TaxID=337810 RepID=UPI003F76DCF7